MSFIQSSSRSSPNENKLIKIFITVPVYNYWIFTKYEFANFSDVSSNSWVIFIYSKSRDYSVYILFMSILFRLLTCR